MILFLLGFYFGMGLMIGLGSIYRGDKLKLITMLLITGIFFGVPLALFNFIRMRYGNRN